MSDFYEELSKLFEKHNIFIKNHTRTDWPDKTYHEIEIDYYRPIARQNLCEEGKIKGFLPKQ